MKANSLNPYLNEIQKNLPRILSLYDRDSLSSTSGLGDRYYWAWGLIDFPNGTFQALPKGLSILIKNGLLKDNLQKERILDLIDKIFWGTKRITRKNGSLEEAFPFESSFCVTSLVASGLLYTIDSLENELGQVKIKEYTEIVEPLISFTKENDESHGFISNHLATAAMALLQWVEVSKDTDAEKKSRDLIDRILSKQSKEGWYDEYGGADPGYQTLSMDYLAEIYHKTNDNDVKVSLGKSIDFLLHFAHPDGSFGGLYGSRNTRFYYPSGILSLAGDFDKAASLSSQMTSSISHTKVPTLSCIDEPNLIPMFNSYASAANSFRKHHKLLQHSQVIYSKSKASKKTIIHFQDAGIFIRKTRSTYTIVNLKKGGLFYHFKGETLAAFNPGSCIDYGKGRIASTQHLGSLESVEINGDKITLTSNYHKISKKNFNPLFFIVLRGLSFFLFNSKPIRNYIKSTISNLLIRCPKRISLQNKRILELGDIVKFKDTCNKPEECKQLAPDYFTSIHMASQDYWHNQTH